MMPNREGEGNMEMFIDERLLKDARLAVAQLDATGTSRVVVEAAEGDTGRPKFYVSREKEGLTVLRTLEVDGQTAYLGLETNM